ncbi:hypothetical protein BC833DRAFT_610219 [Globomyces pollinis-pini]|nr:hypothetical protein BC833DRAFT_610219 [Globomyces pollinis-pini]
MWKNELPQRKRYFINRAKLLYEEHKKLYPDFKWPSKYNRPSKVSTEKRRGSDSDCQSDYSSQSTPSCNDTLSDLSNIKLSPIPQCSSIDSQHDLSNFGQSIQDCIPNVQQKSIKKPNLNIQIPRIDFQFNDFQTGWTPTETEALFLCPLLK